MLIILRNYVICMCNDMYDDAYNDIIKLQHNFFIIHNIVITIHIMMHTFLLSLILILLIIILWNVSNFTEQFRGGGRGGRRWHGRGGGGWRPRGWSGINRGYWGGYPYYSYPYTSTVIYEPSLDTSTNNDDFALQSLRGILEMLKKTEINEANKSYFTKINENLGKYINKNNLNDKCSTTKELDLKSQILDRLSCIIVYGKNLPSDLVTA